MSDTALDEKRIRDEAAQWYARLNNTTITTETLRAFRAWRTDERHADAYAEIEAFWRRVGKLQNDPEIQRAAGEALAREKKPRLGPLPRPGGRTLAAAALVLLLGLAAAFAWPSLVGRTYAAAVGEQRFVTLADGSRLRLDTDTEVRVRLAPRLRRVELLRGRAFFEVAHDAARPFLVRAGTTEVRALGTRFDVRRDRDDVAVTLVEGKVRVEGQADHRAQTWTLTPGQQVVVGPPAATPAVHAVDAEAAVSWTSGRLVFQGRPLGEAVAEVNRYARRKVVLQDEALAARPISGVFDIGDTPAFVAAVSDLFGLRAEDRSGEIVLRPAA